MPRKKIIEQQIDITSERFELDAGNTPIGKTEFLTLLSKRLRSKDINEKYFAFYARMYILVKKWRLNRAGNTQPPKEGMSSTEALQTIDQLVLDAEAKGKK